MNALEAAECRLHGPLTRYVAAEAKRSKQVQGREITLRTFDRAAERNPADAITASTIDLRKPAESGTQRIATERRHGHELGVVIRHLIVDLVAHHDEAVMGRELRQRRATFAVIDGAGGVVGIEDDD